MLRVPWCPGNPSHPSQLHSLPTCLPSPRPTQAAQASSSGSEQQQQQQAAGSTGAGEQAQAFYESFKSGYEHVKSKASAAAGSVGGGEAPSGKRLLQTLAQDLKAVLLPAQDITSATRQYTGAVAEATYDGPTALVLAKQQATGWQKAWDTMQEKVRDSGERAWRLGSAAAGCGGWAGRGCTPYGPATIRARGVVAHGAMAAFQPTRCPRQSLTAEVQLAAAQLAGGSSSCRAQLRVRACSSAHMHWLGRRIGSIFRMRRSGGAPARARHGSRAVKRLTRGHRGARGVALHQAWPWIRVPWALGAQAGSGRTGTGLHGGRGHWAPVRAAAGICGPGCVPCMPGVSAQRRAVPQH